MVKTTPCKLVGENGNVFAILGRASRALKRACRRGDAAEMRARALRANSYDEALAIVCEYVHDEQEGG